MKFETSKTIRKAIQNGINSSNLTYTNISDITSGDNSIISTNVKNIYNFNENGMTPSPTILGDNDGKNIWNQISSLQQALECEICISIMKDTHMLPCGHLFCGECIKGLKKRSCPTCSLPYQRRSIVSVPQLNMIGDRVKELVASIGAMMSPSRMTPMTTRKIAFSSLFGSNPPQTPQILRKERVMKKINNMDIDTLNSEINRIRDWITLKEKERDQVRACIEIIQAEGVTGLNEEKWPILSFLRSRVRNTPSRALSFPDNDQKDDDTTVILEYSRMYSKFDANDICIILTSLSEEDKRDVERAVVYIGGRVLNKFSDEVTHVVALVNSDGRAGRTLKYACGVLHGCWIVSMDWIHESLENERWMNEKPFEVVGDSKDKGAPKKGRERRMKNKPPLFHGIKVYFCGDFTPPLPPLEDLEFLSITGGAEVLHNIQSEYDASKDNLLLIGGQMNTKSREEIETNLGVRAIHYTWLLDSCSHFRVLPIQEYELSRF